MIIDATRRFKPLDAGEQKEFISLAAGYRPLAGPSMD
jgi:hypothetical protein